MSRTSRAILSLAILISTGAPAFTQEPSAWIEELRAIRKALDRQSRQLDALTAEVARLSGGSAAPRVDTGSAPAAAGEEYTDVPKAEAVVRPAHIVVKGDTLTSIAKRYGVTLAEIQQLNKDVKERSLQIGQSIVIPEKADAKPAAADSPAQATQPDQPSQKTE